MSTNWVKDIALMHHKYGAKEPIKKLNENQLRQFLDFRVRFLEEELNELTAGSNTPDDIVDALIDICVVAIGTMDLLEVDANIAWDRVLVANMNKHVGVKSTRPNPLGFPDLIKGDGWIAPDHSDNTGLIPL